MGLIDYKIADAITTIQSLATKVTLTDTQLKAKFDESPEALRVALNGVIDILQAVADGASGADNVKMTPITEIGAENTLQSVIEKIVSILQSVTDGSAGANFIKATAISGLTGADVQTLLEALKGYTDTHKTSTDHDGRYYTETEIAAKVDMTKGAPASVDGVDNAGGDINLVAGTGITITPNNTAKTITITATGEDVPAAHASAHATGGIDEITPASIGAQPHHITDDTVTSSVYELGINNGLLYIRAVV